MDDPGLSVSVAGVSVVEPPRSHPNRLAGRNIVLPLLGILVLAFVGYPVVRGIAYFQADALWQLARPENIAALTNSILLTVLTVIPATIIAVPLAWLCARTDLPGKGAVILLTSVSFVVPALLTAIAYAFLLGRNSGLINRLFVTLFGTRLFDAYSFSGVVLVSILHCYPLIFFTAFSGLTKMNPELEEAGRSCGLSPAGVFLRVTFGAVLPSIMAGVAFASVETLTMLAAPMVLGLPNQIRFVTTELYAKIVLDPNFSQGVAFGLPLIAVTIILLWAQRRLLRDPSGSRFAVVTGKGSRGDLLTLGRWKAAALVLAWLPVTLSLILPVLTLLAAALMAHWFRGFTADNFTLRNFLFVVTDNTTLYAIWNSLILAFGTGFAAAFLGGGIAILLSGPPGFWNRVVHAAVDLPLGLPHVVTGILVILAWYGPPLRLGGTLWILLAGYLFMLLPFAVKTCETAHGQIDTTLVDAAKIIGCSPRQSWYYVLFPLMKNGLLTTFVIVFLVVVKEFSLTAMVYSANTQTLAVRIYTILEGGSYEETAAAAIVLLVLTFVCLAVVGKLFRISPARVHM